MLNDNASRAMADLVCGDNFLSDEYGEICGLYLEYSLIQDAEFDQDYGAAGRRLKATTLELSKYLQSTPTEDVLYENLTAVEERLELDTGKPLWRMIAEAFRATNSFVSTHAGRGVTEFVVSGYFAVRMPFAFANVLLWVGDRALITGVGAIRRRAMQEAEATKYIDLARELYLVCADMLENTLSTQRQVTAQIREIVGKGDQSVLEPYVASEGLLVEVVEEMDRRLSIIETNFNPGVEV